MMDITGDELRSKTNGTLVSVTIVARARVYFRSLFSDRKNYNFYLKLSCLRNAATPSQSVLTVILSSISTTERSDTDA